MSSNFKRFTLAAGMVLTMGYLVGCGTRGENTGFGDKSTGGGAPSLSGAAAAGTAGTGGSITGGVTGTATVNSAFPSTTVTGLTISNMLATITGGGGGAGANVAATRLGFGNFGGGVRPVVVQGFGAGTLGRVSILPRNPEATPGTSNILLAPNVGTASPQSLTNPFGLLVDGSTIYVTEGATSGATGRIIRYTGINTTTGQCTGDQIAIGLNRPVDIAKDGNFLYVAEFGATGVGNGQVTRIDLSTTPPTVVRPYIASVSFCSSLVTDTANGHHFLYVAENAAGVGGTNGSVTRIDLSTFASGTGLTGTGVQQILPATGQTAYSNPYDLAVDGFSNVVITEGLNAVADQINPSSTGGAIRVITGGTTPAITSQVVLQNSTSGSTSGLSALRGISLFNEDSTGTVLTGFFTEGPPTALTSTLRQVTFRASDAAIFRHLILDSGKQSPLDTLFDQGDTSASPVIRPNVKYTQGAFGTAGQGQVLDVR
ncbi:MAG: hypothetical protein J0I12_10380 [Candidatus Eremiobacteraeota bacterium]|nr:hypothetical protein [Candidatus Eremiobacteraeota bacterium]